MNQIILTGNLVRDNELKYTSTGKACLKNSIAVKKTKDKTYFFEFSMWEEKADTFSKYTHKGSKVLLSGELTQEVWQDKTSGQNRSKVSITAYNFEFLDSKPASQDQGNGNNYNKIEDGIPF